MQWLFLDVNFFLAALLLLNALRKRYCPGVSHNTLPLSPSVTTPDTPPGQTTLVGLFVLHF